MKKLNIYILLMLIAPLLLFSGCEVIGDIFEAGMWVGVIMVALVVGIIIWIIRKIS